MTEPTQRLPWGPLHATTEDKTDCIKTADLLSLDSIRSNLIRQEETIIFSLIQRTEFRTNSIVYEKGGFGNLGTPLGSKPPPGDAEEESLSFLEYLLMGTVSLNAIRCRQESPSRRLNPVAPWKRKRYIVVFEGLRRPRRTPFLQRGFLVQAK